MSRRRKSPPEPPVLGPTDDEEVRRYRGHWVAVKNGRVVFGAREHGAVYDWLGQHAVGKVLIMRIPAENEPENWTFLARALRSTGSGGWSAQGAGDISGV